MEYREKTYDIHFVALFSKKADAVPIISSHGWPGSFLEYLPQLNFVRQSYTEDTLPYHLIIPSLPGFCLSSGPPKDKDFIVQDAAAILHQLMLNIGFGKSGYVATGGDIGAIISRMLGAKYKECKAVQLNFSGMRENPDLASIPLSDADKKRMARAKQFLITGHGYALEQGTRPATLGFVLASNPLALLAWVGEKFLEWSDETPHLNTILMDVTLYWFTQTMPRALYNYRQEFGPHVKGHNLPELRIEKPFG